MEWERLGSNDHKCFCLCIFSLVRWDLVPYSSPSLLPVGLFSWFLVTLLQDAVALVPE